MYEDHCEQSLRGDCMNNISSYENLSNKEMQEIVKFGFTKKGFEKFKKAFELARSKACQQQK